MQGKAPQKSLCIICHHPDDKGWADWLAVEIGSYHVPRKIIGFLSRRGDRIPERIGPVTTLDATSEVLHGKRVEALKEADFLIAVCSPSAAASDGIGQCLRFFKSIGNSERIIAAIVEGVPNASGSLAAQECFHAALRYEVDQDGRVLDLPAEPLAADFRVEGCYPAWYDHEAYEEALVEAGRGASEASALGASQAQRVRLMQLKLVAGILGLGLGELTERDKAYQSEIRRRRLLRWTASFLVVAVLLAGLIHGLGVLAEYRKTAASAAETEKIAKQHSESADKGRREIEILNRSQAQILRIAEEKAKGLSYLNGDNGLPVDRALALKHLGVAASAGDTGANLWLARLMVDKPNADEETKAGMERLMLVKAGGVMPEAAEAAYRLGQIFADGKITQQDRDKAVAFTEFASTNGHVPAMEPFAYLLERGWAGPQRQKEALAWYERASAAGSPEGLFALYLINLQGRPTFGVSPDEGKAADYLERAAKAGSPRALYLHSLTLKDPAEIEVMLERSAKAGESRAITGLVALYLKGTHGHAIVVDKGVMHAGQALDQAIRAKNLKMVDDVTTILAEAGVFKHCASIGPQLMKATEMGSARSAYVYAIAKGLGADGTVANLDAFKSNMLKAAEAGLPEAQYDYGSKVMKGLIPGENPETGAIWIEKAASKSYPPSLILAAKNRSAGGLMPKDWVMASDFMKRAARYGLEVDWSALPRRFRPTDPTSKPADAPGQPKLRPVMPDVGMMEEALQIVRGKARRSKESVDLVLRVFPAHASWSEQQLNVIGLMLMSVGRYDDGVVYLSRAIMRQDASNTHQAARTLANYFESTKPALAYQWYLVAQSRFFARNTEIAQSRIRINETQKEAAFAAAGALLAQDAVDVAAEGAGLADMPTTSSPRMEGAAGQLIALLKKADNLLAKTEFPEEAEDAQEAYLKALVLAPGSVPVMTGLGRAARALGDDKKAFYWLIRCAYAKRTSSESGFESYVHLADAYARGAGVRVDTAEAAKWRQLARLELTHAEAIFAAVDMGEDGRRGFTAAKKTLSEVDGFLSVSPDDPALGLRLKMHKAWLAQPPKR